MILSTTGSERPSEPIALRKTPAFRINRILTGIFNFFHQDGLRYRALSSEDSLQLLLQSRKSLIRYGNGESEILIGLDMQTQTHNRELAGILAEILTNYSPDSPYLLALTNWNLTRSVRELKQSHKQRKYRMWRYMRYLFHKYRLAEKDLPFLETDMFRAGEVGLERKKIEALWAGITNIIIVHNSERYFTWFKEEYGGKKVFFVRIPDKNFFSVLHETQEEILRVVRENAIDRHDLAVLVSAGPGANALCYNLSNKDHALLCYDMGNFFHMHCRAPR